MKVYLSNAFSLQMVESNCDLSIINIPVEDVGALLWAFWKNGEIIPAIGHADTAKLVADMLQGWAEAEVVEIATKPNRVNVKLIPGAMLNDNWENGDLLIVAQYIGPRLPEGCKVLPEGARIEFRMVSYINRNV